MQIITESLVDPVDAYLARPADGQRHPLVLVGMELFGVDEHIRDVTERVARLGYVAVAPNFYHRTLPRQSLPYGDDGRARGFEHLRRLTRADLIADTRAVIAGFGTGHVGFVGFSSGAHFAYLAATELPIDATVLFYPGWLTTTDLPFAGPEPTIALTPTMSGKVLLFAGGRDHVVTSDDLSATKQALDAAGVENEVVVYPDASHGFFCDRRAATFDAAARDDAWQRAKWLLAERLRGEPTAIPPASVPPA